MEKYSKNLDLNEVLSALQFVDDGDFNHWTSIAMALKSAGASFEDFHNWSRKGSKYKSESDCRQKWANVDASGGTTFKTIFHFARQNGWKNENFYKPIVTKPPKPKVTEEPIKIREYWDLCVNAPIGHPYIVRKKGIPDGIRLYPETAPELIVKMGKESFSARGCLAVPVWENEMLQAIQFFAPDGKKGNISGIKFNGGYFEISGAINKIYILEGLGHAWTTAKATGCLSVVTFGFQRIRPIAKLLKEKYPDAQLILVADTGEEANSDKIAKELNLTVIKLGVQIRNNYDINDYEMDYGIEKVKDLLCIIKYPLDIVMASNLSEDFEAPDEIIEDIITAGDGSIIYGDSNCGKTYLVIDMAASLSQGADWFGRKTESGIVVYLAAESPGSIQSRLRAYQKYYNVRLQNFIIVKNPIDLFDGDGDTKKIIDLIKIIEEERKIKVKWVIGDTLARLSAGADENAGKDMGVVIKHFDKIRTEGKTHFTLIHHCGKKLAAGARGWSGVKAAVDTEIEVTDTPDGKCAEITKQRDLSSKGLRIGFDLKPIEMGKTKWGKAAFSCIVIEKNAPEIKLNTNKRQGAIGDALKNLLKNYPAGLLRIDIINKLPETFVRESVYKEIRKMLERTELINDNDLIKLSN